MHCINNVVYYIIIYDYNSREKNFIYDIHTYYYTYKYICVSELYQFSDLKYHQKY